MEAAVRVMNKLRSFNGPGLPKLLLTPTSSVWFKCRVRLYLTLVTVIESGPDNDLRFPLEHRPALS